MQKHSLVVSIFVIRKMELERLHSIVPKTFLSMTFKLIFVAAMFVLVSAHPSPSSLLVPDYEMEEGFSGNEMGESTARSKMEDVTSISLLVGSGMKDAAGSGMKDAFSSGIKDSAESGMEDAVGSGI